jgi:1-phosphatidylinositol-3-phosphate 5-kinase
MPFHRQVPIDLAPSYFRYMDSTTGKATVPAKSTGFYTVEIRSLETGNVQSKADPLVMENLFYAQAVARTVDPKSIQGRRVKAAATGGPSPKTLFDGEWIESMLPSPVNILRAHVPL